jgi:hypothetical protein
VVILPVLLSLLLFIPAIQTKVAHVVTARLSNDLRAEITVESVHITPLGRLVINSILLKDRQSDTLLYSKRLSGSIESFSYKKRIIRLNDIILTSPKANIYPVDSGYNFDFLRDTTTIDSESPRWTYLMSRIQINNGTAGFIANDTLKAFPKINTNNLSVSNINILINKLDIENDAITFELKNFSFMEKSGLSVTQAFANFIYTPQQISITSFGLTTSYSSIEMDTLLIHAPNDSDSIQFNKNTPFKLNLNKLQLSPNDLSYFTTETEILKSPINLSGKFSGSLANLKAKEMVLSFGEKSFIETKFEIVGLPNLNETFLFCDIQNLSTNVTDLELLFTEVKGKGLTSLPPSLKQLGAITYTGNITGFINDLVAYGRFDTNMGSLNTDIGVKLGDRINFSGSFNTIGFNLGKLLNAKDDIGRVTMKMTINGNRKSTNNYYAYMQGKIDSISINQYTYQNIELNGLFSNHKFDGQFDITDPNGALNFSGNIDFSHEIPNFNFFARLSEIKLDKLNLAPQLKNTTLSLDVISNFEGNNINDLTGFIRMDNGVLSGPDKMMLIDSLVVSATRIGDKKQLLIQSDLADGEVFGNYNFSHFISTIKHFTSYYLPSVFPKEKLPASEQNEWDFRLSLKKMGQLIHFLNPEIEITGQSNFLGNFNHAKQILYLEGDIESFRYHQFKGEKLHLFIDGKKELITNIHFNNFVIGDFINFNNLTLQQKALGDKLDNNLFWNDWGEVTNGGSIFSTTQFSKNNGDGLVSEVQLQTSQIIVKDTVWNIKPSQIVINNNGYTIDDFRIWHANQQFAVDGSIKKSGDDGLNGYIRNLNLSEIFANIELGELTIGGILDGEFQAKNLYTNPSVIGDLAISGLSINKENIGQFHAISSWDPAQKAISLTANLEKNNIEKLNGKGFWQTNSNEIDFQADVNKLEISFINIYLKKILQNLTGNASGIVRLNGNISNPVLTGRLKLNESQFDIGYLKTTYNLTDSVIFEPQQIVFKNMVARDRQNHRATFNGYINHVQFGKMRYNLQLQADNFLALDTKLKDNPLYYGTVFTTGSVRVSGITSSIVIDIVAKTRENSQFFIPLQETSEALSNDFIRFKTDDSTKLASNRILNDYIVDLSGIEVNMDVEVTPQAKIQIVFDPKTGDILKGSGQGDIQIKIDKNTNITIYGDYAFDEGDYLFSLQNVINKRFFINRGSRVKWDGDPYNALINITATYRLRASMYDLVGASMTSADRNADLQKRVPINCNLILTDRLLKPSIRFEIETPSNQDNNQNLIKEYIRTQEELNRQVLSLLVLNRFYSPESQKSSDLSSNRIGNNAALVTTTEVLSNQLSHWLSQINKDVDIGVSYRPGDEITSQEIEVALSTQILNERVTLNGNVGYGDYQTSASNLIGDFDLDVKLNRIGNLRAHAYTRTNNDVIYETSPTTQGVGVSFREEFDSWGELLKKYWAWVRGDERKKKRKDTNKSEQPPLLQQTEKKD